jgi:folate-binding protein YgfZ
LRIEAGTPVFGRDVTADNLPQEVGRDNRAISFVKGCYLGQETVARIDALGHVNKLMKGLRLRGPAPHPIVGATLEHDGKKVGTVTSAAFSPGWGTTVALGYVRSSQAVDATELVVVAEGGEPLPAVVCDLPMIPQSI